jgi:hypothetical protein
MKSVIFVASILLFSCSENKPNGTINTSSERGQISAMLDSFNIAAARADFDGYFRFFADSAIFIGTDATEHWTKTEFMKWAKPHFDKKKTWNFKSVKRNIYFGPSPDIVWFDELLSTQMKICRGSGVVVKKNNQWKVAQYVLSMTIPNQNVEDVLKIKSSIEDSVLNTLHN